MKAEFPDSAKQKLAQQRTLEKPKKFFIPYPVKLRRDPKKNWSGMVKKSRDFIRSFPEMYVPTDVPAPEPKKQSPDSPIKRLQSMAIGQKIKTGSGNQLKLMKNAMILRNKKDEQYKGSAKSVANSASKLPTYETPKTKLNNNENQSTQQLGYTDNDPTSKPKPADPKDPVPTPVASDSGPGLTKPNTEVPKEAPAKPVEKPRSTPLGSLIGKKQEPG